MKYLSIVLLFIVAISQLICPINSQALPADEEHKQRLKQSISRVKYNLKPIDLKRDITNKDLMSAGQLGGQLYPTHDAKQIDKKDIYNRKFGIGINKWNKHEYKDAVKFFRKYAKEYPESPWAAEALLHIGCDARYNGRYDEAWQMFTDIIDKHQNSSHPGAMELVSKARLRLGVLYYLQNNPIEAKETFQKLKAVGTNWRHRTYAAHWLTRIKSHESNRIAMLNCGVQALATVLEIEGYSDKARTVKGIKPSSLLGQSMLELQTIAAENDLQLQARRLFGKDLKNIPLPAIIQISAKSKNARGHFWVLEKAKRGDLFLYDPQNKRRFTQSVKELENQWDGAALIKGSNKDKLPGTKITEEDLSSLFGGCCGAPAPESNLGAAGPNGVDGPNPTNCPLGSPAWQVNMVSLNFYMRDIPMWYKAPIGPSMYISLSYNSQSTIAHYEPFGNKWQFNYATYPVEDTSGNVTIFMPDGRRDTYVPAESGGPGYDRPYQVFNTLTKLAENHYELKFPDDTIYVYNIPAGTTSLQPFIVEIRDPHGQSMTFGYDANIQLDTITDAMNRSTHLNYNAQGLVERAVDPFGREALFEYDGNNNLTKITDIGGYWFEFSYDADVFLTGLTTSKGTTQFNTELPDYIYTLENNNNYPPPGTEMYGNYRITVTHPNNEIEEFFYYGGDNEYGVDGYTWHVKPKHYIPWLSSEINNFAIDTPKTIYIPSMLGYYFGSRLGEVQKIIRSDGSYLEYGFDGPTGDRTSITDNSNNKIQYTYNSQGRITTMTNKQGKVTTYVYDPANDIDLLEIQNELGTIILTYNDRHQVKSITDQRNLTTNFDYNEYGQLITLVDANTITTSYLYDSNNYLQEIKRNGLTQYQFTRDAIGRKASQTDPTGLILQYAYNNLDKLTEIIYPDTKTINITYAGCCPDTIDSYVERSGRTSFFEYDEMNNRTSVTRPDDSRIRYLYDANGNLEQLIDTNNNTTKFEYDGNDRLIRKIFADGKKTSYQYDTVGRLSKRIDARNVTTDYHYDAYNNLSGISYSDGTPTVTFTYDEFNRMTGMTDGTGTSTYSFNANSLVETVDGPWVDDTLTYQYDNLNRVASTQVQGGRLTSHSYDNQQRLYQVQAGNDISTYTYKSNISPLVDRLTRPNGSYVYYQYDGLNRLASIENKNSANAVITKNGFTYNEMDQIGTENIQIDEAMPGFTNGLTTYNHNEVNQMLSSDNPNRSFVYDNAGNMTQGHTPEGYVYSATYDAENRLSTIQHTDSSNTVHKAEFVYNGLNLLGIIKRYENGLIVDETRIVRNGHVPIQERSGINVLDREYSWGLDLAGGVGGLLNMQYQGQSYDYLYDGKGNVSALTDEAQAVIASYRYDSFGRLKSKSGVLDQPMQFSTKRYLANVGLNYYGYRFYASDMGRWINRDPLQETGGLNLYGFVQNNPVNMIDPDGRLAFLLPAVPPALAALGKAAAYVGSAMIAGALIAEAIDDDDADEEGGESCPTEEKSNQRGNSPTGEPNTWVEHPHGKQDRFYGPDGNPLVDIDYGHDHGQGQPHAHNWKDGVREDGVPVSVIKK